MNRFFVIFIFLSFFSFSQKKDIAKNKVFGERLIANNFLEFADADKMDSLRAEVVDSFNIYNAHNHRIAAIDAEELAELNFDFFIPELNKILAKRKYHLEVKIQEDFESSFEIVINNEKIKLFTKNELEDYSFWDTAPRNFFKKVNKLLVDNGIKEQFYLLYSGNDLNTMLLTDLQAKIISEYYNFKQSEIPYLP